jgi:hypothetical protein
VDVKKEMSKNTNQRNETNDDVEKLRIGYYCCE